MFIGEAFSSPCDAYGAEQSLLFLTFLLGLTPFRLRGTIGERHFVISRIGYLNTLLQLSFFMYCFGWALAEEESIAGFFFQSDISRVGDTLQKFIGMIGMVTLFACSSCRCREIMRLCDKIATIDEHFRYIGVNFNYGFIKKLRYIKIFLVILVNVSYLASSLWMLLQIGIRPTMQASVAFYVPHVFLLAVVVLYSAFLMRIWQHFDLLNKLLSNLYVSYKIQNAILTESELFQKNLVWGFVRFDKYFQHLKSKLSVHFMCCTVLSIIKFPGVVANIIHKLVMWLLCYFRRMLKPNDVYTSFSLVLSISFIFGIMPYHISLETMPPQLHDSYIGYCNIFARMVFYNFNLVLSLLEQNSLLSNFFITDVSRATDGLQKVNGIFGIFTVLLLSWLRRRQLQKLLNEFNMLEVQKFLEIGVSFHHYRIASKINRFAMLLVFTMIAFVTISFTMIFSRSGVTLTHSAAVTFFSPHFVVCAFTILFHGILIKVADYIDAMNKVLQNLSHQWNPQCSKLFGSRRQRSYSLYTIVTQEPTEIVQKTMDIHRLICRATYIANKYFAYQLLTIISIAFLIVVFDAFYVLETLLGKSKYRAKFKTVEFVIFFSCQMLLYMIAIITIIESSNHAIKKSLKTANIVHTLLSIVKCSEAKEKLQQFSMQLLHLKVNFTAAGLFNVDRTLYFTITGALTNILIILLQFTINAPSHEMLPEDVLLIGKSTNNTF